MGDLRGRCQLLGGFEEVNRDSLALPRAFLRYATVGTQSPNDSRVSRGAA